MKTDHIEWLMLEKNSGDYYTFITRKFGGQGDAHAAISIRRNVIDLTLVGERELDPQTPTLSRKIYPISKAELGKFKIYGFYQTRVQDDLLSQVTGNEENPDFSSGNVENEDEMHIDPSPFVP